MNVYFQSYYNVILRLEKIEDEVYIPEKNKAQPTGHLLKLVGYCHLEA